MLPSTDDLLAIARHYWPASMAEALEEANPEFQRRSKRWNEALRQVEQWDGFRQHLKALLPDCSMGDGTTTSQASFRCIVYPAKGIPLPPIPWAVVGCMSILAPVFTVYGITFEYEGRKRRAAQLHLTPLAGPMEETARIVARELEFRYHVNELPREVAATPVPVVVEWTEPPKTTLFDAFFDSDPTNIP